MNVELVKKLQRCELVDAAHPVKWSGKREGSFSVKLFNRKIRQFPGSFFAPGMGLKKREYFEPPAGRAAVEKAPEVKF